MAEQAIIYPNGGAWEKYTFLELGNIVHVLAEESAHVGQTKAQNYLGVAQHYLDMMQSKLNELKGN